MNFRMRPNAFTDDRQKVNYVISYLEGTALECFEPYLTGDPRTKPRWATNLDGFIDEL